ncbi:MAG: hypothetical protein A4S17_12890 [Proteobacteria bacterium HN_bin10]|nr:MAG: hypothetical protein A4S17_12890 [Proteobacteria bacterium HN_bin10]
MCAVLSGASSAAAEPSISPTLSAIPAHPFPIGERLTYALSYLAIQAGTATMEVHLPPAGGPGSQLLLVNTAKSSKFVTRFFPVDNRVESYVDATSLAPQHFIFHRREGKKKNDFDVTFLHAEGKAAGTKDGEAYAQPIPADTHDVLSCLYYFRNLPSLQPGARAAINIHHDRKNYKIEVVAEAIERLSGAWGEGETIRLLVIMPFQGLFLNEGNIRLWVTNDARRLPVMMQAKVIIGSIVAKLVQQG